MLQVAEQAPGEVARSNSALIEFKAEMRSLVQTKAVADTIVQSVLFTTGLIFLIPEYFGKVVDIAINELRLCNLKEAFMAAAGTELSIEHSTPRPKS